MQARTLTHTICAMIKSHTHDNYITGKSADNYYICHSHGLQNDDYYLTFKQMVEVFFSAFFILGWLLRLFADINDIFFV